LIWLLAFIAAAETPNPDRPTVAMTSGLVAADTFELEAGGLWSRDNGVGAPILLKYSFGGFEPRIGFDGANSASGAPGLNVGTKFHLDSGTAGTASAFFGSAVPVATGETWSGSVQLLASTGVEQIGVLVNVGVAFEAEGPFSVAGVPVALVVSLPPFIPSCGVFVESAAVLDQGLGQGVLDGGIACLVTEIVMIDTAFGYTMDDGSPFAQLGLAVNFGTLGAK